MNALKGYRTIILNTVGIVLVLAIILVAYITGMDSNITVALLGIVSTTFFGGAIKLRFHTDTPAKSKDPSQLQE